VTHPVVPVSRPVSPLDPPDESVASPLSEPVPSSSPYGPVLVDERLVVGIVGERAEVARIAETIGVLIRLRQEALAVPQRVERAGDLDGERHVLQRRDPGVEQRLFAAGRRHEHAGRVLDGARQAPTGAILGVLRLDAIERDGHAVRI
jgi:hypothetical protein